MNSLQMREPGCRPFRNHQRAGFAGEFTCTSERAIGDQSVAHSLDGVVALVRRQRGQPPTSLISEYENTILMCD
jgi:hypothetical protein